jgi:hypothetical protein
MWATCPRSASSGYHTEFRKGCYHKHTNLRYRWPVWNKATFVMDEEKLIILVQGRGYLYNLQHKDYDNNLVKDNCWKEIAEELHAQDKELSRRTHHCRRLTRSWQGRGRVVAGRGRRTAGKWHGNGRETAWYCELAFNTAGERHGMCESAFRIHGAHFGNHWS